MKALMFKELRLSLQPVSVLFLLLVAMLFIPNYPYEVAFFYVTLGIFFICMLGRENHDVDYSLLLPVRKGDLVKARLLLCMGLELAELILAVPVILMRSALHLPANAAGLDANVALLGSGFLLFTLFNLVFFCSYYKDVSRVGIPFLKGSAAVLAYLIVEECLVFAAPFVRDCIDTPDPDYLGLKLAFTALAGALYVVGGVITCRVGIRRFERLDF